MNKIRVYDYLVKNKSRVYNWIARLLLDEVDFSEVKDSSSGEFGFGTAIGQAFDIVALPLPEPVQPTNNSVMLYIIAGTTLLLAVIIFTLRKVMKRKSDRKGKK